MKEPLPSSVEEVAPPESEIVKTTEESDKPDLPAASDDTSSPTSYTQTYKDLSTDEDDEI